VIYGAYGQFTGAELFLNLSPSELINIANNTIQQVLNLEMSDLLLEWETFAEYQEAKMELLEDANALLGDPLNINPLMFVYREPRVILGEGASGFFDRTVNNANPGLLSIDFLQNFYDVSLKLPETI